MDAGLPQHDQIIKLAVMAVGGQGGGVLSNWIIDLAEANGWRAQSTAVAGVAQRTGATIYYIEMAPDTGRDPVFSLSPAPGDIDVLVAAEWMEAGRAVMRGFVSPDKTTLIASTHRAFSIAEKVVPGDGAVPNASIDPALDASAKRVIAFDMQTPAIAAGSVISASLFGAMAGADVLPFPATAYEETIRAGGRSVDGSLAAFRAGLAGPPPAEATCANDADEISGPAPMLADYRALAARIDQLPEMARPMAEAGLRRVTDFQDIAYGSEYLDHVGEFADLDATADNALTIAAAKYIAVAMAYDDVIRVADLKTRVARRDRIAAEFGPTGAARNVTEFLHPRVEELCSVLPRRWGQWIEDRPRLAGWIDRRINRGRRIRTDTILGFATLYVTAGLKRRRRGMLRHHIEMQHMADWLQKVREAAQINQQLAAEILACRRLIKGYSDTHIRGQSKFDKVIGALGLLQGRHDAADWIRRLREAALQDADGAALEGALKTVASFAAPPASEQTG